MSAVTDDSGRVGAAERCRFPVLSWEQMCQHARERKPFLLPGLVCSTLTLFIGEPEAGKSTLAAGLIVALLQGRDFLGREVSRPVERIVFLTTELDGIAEMTSRLSDAGITEAPQLSAVPVSAVTAEDWRQLVNSLSPCPGMLVVLDNLSQVIPEGSINEDAAVRVVIDGLRRFTAAGAAVILVHHTSDKRTQHGRSTKPMGHTSINGAARWTVRVERTTDGLKLDCHGNGAVREEIYLTQGEMVTDLDVAREVDGREMKQRHRQRGEERNANLDRMATFVQTECSGMSKAETARKLVDAGLVTGKQSRSVEADLAPGKPLGRLLEVRGHAWGK